MVQMAINIIGTMSESPRKHFFIRNIGGGSVMVWAAISSHGSSELVFLEGKQNPLKYVESCREDFLQGFSLSG